MTANPHYAQSQMEDAPEWAQIEALRALAYEQRTANLIALYSMDDDARQGMIDGADMHGAKWVDVTKQIAERLGLA